jgi:hypothetical protein
MKCLGWMPFLFILLTSSEAVSGENDSLKHENQLLETELRIAQTRQPYSIFDLKNKKIYLKARGLLLRELSIDVFRVWGNLPAVKAATLIRKSALFPPKRVLMNPKAGDDDVAQPGVETLELKDMPTNYTLVLEGNISISVRPKPTHLLSSLLSIRYPVQWYLARPVLTVWHALWRKPFTSVEIVLEQSDARSLYWSFLEGMKAIVISPRNRP